jgi:hypothetical protein
MSCDEGKGNEDSRKKGERKTGGTEGGEVELEAGIRQLKGKDKGRGSIKVEKVK